MRLFHTTSPESADAILAGGFRDHPDGVWLADDPTDDGVRGSGAVLRVEIPAEALSPYEVSIEFDRWDTERREWVPDHERPAYRAWCLPATLVNLSEVRRTTKPGGGMCMGKLTQTRRDQIVWNVLKRHDAVPTATATPEALVDDFRAAKAAIRANGGDDADLAAAASALENDFVPPSHPHRELIVGLIRGAFGYAELPTYDPAFSIRLTRAGLNRSVKGDAGQ